VRGWLPPRTPSGRAALSSPPPWHLSAETLSVDFVTDPGRAQDLLPEGFRTQDGRASVVFGEWSSASDEDPRWIADPARGQYREAYVVLYAADDAGVRGRVPFIWVDSDLSLVRGLAQGFPKKLGQIAISRPVSVGRGGPRREPGQRHAAHVSGLGRRLAAASVVLESAEPASIPPGLATPLVHTRWWPRMSGEEAAVDELSRARITDFRVANVHRGRGSIEFGDSEFEELRLLEPVSVGDGWICSIAFTIEGMTES
jgi:acetoacetate decarboxylase